MNAKLTKGLAAAAISAAMMLGAAAPALAQGPIDTTTNKVNLDVNYTVKGDGVAPEETITYKQVDKKSSDNATYKPNMTTDNPDLLDIPDLRITEAKVSNSQKTGAVVLEVPTYTSVGKYTYTLTRQEISAAGVTDKVPTTITVVVTVENKDGKFNRYVNIFNGTETSDAKKKITNVGLEYASGKLTVKKQVSGNLGDTTGKTKFDFKIELHGPKEKDKLNDTYHYTVKSDPNKPKAITFTEGEAVLPNTQLGHDDYITFTDLPAGVTYTVKELNNSQEVLKGGDAEYGYKLEDIDTKNNGTETIDANETDSVTYTNNKTDTGIDTGVLLNNAPYIAIIGGAAVVAIYVVNKRRHSDMD